MLMLFRWRSRMLFYLYARVFRACCWENLDSTSYYTPVSRCIIIIIVREEKMQNGGRNDGRIGVFSRNVFHVRVSNTCMPSNGSSIAYL